MPTIKLTYFNAPGRAEPIRVALALAGLEFEDCRLGYPEFAEHKARGALPLGSVPILEVDGVTLTQTAAMLRYVARLGAGNLYPSDPYAALLVDSALDSFNDTLSNALLPSIYERDMAIKLELRKTFAAGPMVKVFGYVEGLLGQTDGPFLAGKSLSIADLVIAHQIIQIRDGHLDGLTPALLDAYPRLAALTDGYLADPRVAGYRSR